MTIGEIWGWTINGMWQSQDEIDAAEAGAKAAGQKFYNNLIKQHYTGYYGVVFPPPPPRGVKPGSL